HVPRLSASRIRALRDVRRRRRRPGRRMNLVLDWDGTITVRDSLVAAIHALGDPSVYDGGIQGKFGSYGEALAAEVATLRVSAEEAAAWAVENVEVSPGFHELVE